MVFVETSFPRGGIDKSTLISSQPRAEIEYGASTFKKRKDKLNKRQRDEKRIHANDEKEDNIEAISAELLSLKTITEGMIIMGCIQKIDPTHLIVSLPGNLTGKVLVTAISKSYVGIVNRYVHDADSVEGYKTLEDMFRIGQIVCVKVIEISQSTRVGQSKVTIGLSMNPADIQCDFKHNRIDKDAIICVSIEDIADHGYIIDTGITNLRGFLPTANITAEEEELGIGEVLFCKVEKTTKAQAASTVICKMIDIGERKMVSSGETNLSYILPSGIVSFKVTKVLPDGLQGTIMKDAFIGYVNEHQLTTATSQPENYRVDDVLEARILYVMPLTKLVYLSLNLVEQFGGIGDGTKLRVGSIVEQARVIKIGTGGLVMKLNGVSKGLVSFKSLRIGYDKNFDSDELMAKYYKNSVHRVRITAYDVMDSLFVCTNSEEIINEKFYSLDDVEITDYVDAQIINQLDDGGYFVRVGRIRGYLEKIQISSTTSASRLVPGAKLRCRIIRKNAATNKLFLSNRKEYMVEGSLLLRSYAKAVVGLDYHGMIVKILPDGFVVNFCNYVKGFLYKRNLNEGDALSTSYFYVGHITKFRIIDVRDNEHIILGLESFVSQIGTVLQAKVTTVSPSGLNISFANSIQMDGFVPIMFLSAFPSLAPLLHETYKPNASIDVVCAGRNVYNVRDMERLRTKPVKEWSQVQVGDVLPAFVKDVNGQVIDMYSFVADYTKAIKCHAKMLLEDYEKAKNIDLVAEQLLFVRVLGKNDILKTLTCSAKLSHVWNGDLKETASQFRQYLKDLQRIKEYSLQMKIPIASLTIGDRVTGKVVKTEADQVHVKLPNSVQGVVSAKSLPAVVPTLSSKIDCLVIWIDYGRNIVHLAGAKKLLERHTKNMEIGMPTSKFLLKARRGLKADVILVHDDVVVTYPRKATEKFVFIPTRLHFNDLQPVVLNDVREGAVANITALESDGGTVIGMFESIVKLLDQAKNALKAKRNADSGNRLVDEEAMMMTDQDAEIADSASEDGLYFVDTAGTSEVPAGTPTKKKSKKRKATDDAAAVAVKVVKKVKSKQRHQIDQLDGAADCSASDSDDDDEYVPHRNVKLRVKKRLHKPAFDGAKTMSKLPGAGEFWSAARTKIETTAASGSDEELERLSSSSSSVVSSKKPKLSTADRFRMMRTEETRVRRVEEGYANANAEPMTVDQFERQVMATPNASLAWINYMVFHMQSSEIHKARLVARKAIKKISFRESEELLNVWVALLNLELRYGDPEQFDATLLESMQTNDQFKIYVKCLAMLADVKKIDALTEIILKFTQKFKAQPECWSAAAAAYFEVGLGEKAQQLLNRALKSLPDRDHVNTIVKFAVLNNRFGHADTAHALMEQILTSYPKRVDCWSQYVDMLIKDKEIATARQILNRAVSQRIPMKKMRTLFKKYLDFEERFGDASSVLKVKGLASTYIDKELKA